MINSEYIKREVIEADEAVCLVVLLLSYSLRIPQGLHNGRAEAQGLEQQEAESSCLKHRQEADREAGSDALF